MAFFLFFGFGEEPFIIEDALLVLIFISGNGKPERAAKLDIIIGVLLIIGVYHKAANCGENAELNKQMLKAGIEASCYYQHCCNHEGKNFCGMINAKKVN